MSERPSEAMYTKTHEWVSAEDGVVTLGITDFAVEHLGDLVFVDLPDVDDELEAGDRACEVESVKAVVEVYSPVAGKIVATNEALADELGPLSEDPFGAGWLIRIEPAPGAEPAGLMDLDAYEKQLAAEDNG